MFAQLTNGIFERKYEKKQIYSRHPFKVKNLNLDNRERELRV